MHKALIGPKLTSSWSHSLCGFAHDNWRRKLSKIFDRLRLAGKSARGFEVWSVRVQTKVLKANGPERSNYPNWDTRPRERGFEKWSDDWNQLGRAQEWRQDCNFQDRSFYWRREDSKTKGMKWLAKIEVETTKNNRAIVIGCRGHKGK